jgi:hypothetical protein
MDHTAHHHSRQGPLSSAVATTAQVPKAEQHVTLDEVTLYLDKDGTAIRIQDRAAIRIQDRAAIRTGLQ